MLTASASSLRRSLGSDVEDRTGCTCCNDAVRDIQSKTGAYVPSLKMEPYRTLLEGVSGCVNIVGRRVGFQFAPNHTAKSRCKVETDSFNVRPRGWAMGLLQVLGPMRRRTSLSPEIKRLPVRPGKIPISELELGTPMLTLPRHIDFCCLHEDNTTTRPNIMSTYILYRPSGFMSGASIPPLRLLSRIRTRELRVQHVDEQILVDRRDK